MKLNWVKTIYGPPNGNGWHVHSLVKWKDRYYIAFADGSGHDSDDSQARLCVSSDLENWDTLVAVHQKDTGRFTSEPQLMPVGDRMYIYAVTADHSYEYDFPPHSRHPKFPSWEVMSWTEDGENWTKPKRCYTMNYDFWHPISHGGRYYVACDGSGHNPEGVYSTVDLLTSEDGERWTWVSEIVHGFEMPAEDDPDYPKCGYPSECALIVLDDERMLAVTRTPGSFAILSTALPPYEQWQHRSSGGVRLKGAAVARVGEHIVATGRSFAVERGDEFSESFSDYDKSGLRVGVHLYEEEDFHLKVVLPSGGDTGYGGILATGERDFLVAYYSSHEYPPETPGSNVYLASLTID